MTMVPNSKGLQIFFAVVVGVAIIGFFVGTRSGVFEASKLSGFGADAPRAQAAGEARNYSELMEAPYRKNEHWEGSLTALSREFEPAERGEKTGRAFDGAPPTIPHPVRQTGATECMACHGAGLKIDDRVATPMNHEFMTNCTQCHVPTVSPMPFDDTRYVDFPLNNSFEGL